MVQDSGLPGLVPVIILVPSRLSVALGLGWGEFPDPSIC